MNSSKRFEELDSLRGLAATSVIFCHIFPLLSFYHSIDLIINSPLHIFFAGHEAVILFFILSGFVLSLPYFNNNAPRYKAYLIRRICRIYIPYIVSVYLAIISMIMFYRIDVPEIGWWFDVAKHPIPPLLILKHVLLLGEFDSAKFNMVIWSLVHEMRISLVFPAIVYIVMKFRWKQTILIAASCSLLFYTLYIFCLKFFHYDATKLQGSYLSTLHYTFFFILGALLAKHKQFFTVFYGKLTKLMKLSLLALSLLTYTYTWWFFHEISYLHIFVFNDWCTAIGALIMIIFCLNSKTIKAVMLYKPIHFIGKISYSLYLYHLIIILSCLNILSGKIARGWILSLSFIFTYLVASIMYYIIEKRSVSLGRFLASGTAKKSNISKRISA